MRAFWGAAALFVALLARGASAQAIRFTGAPAEVTVGEETVITWESRYYGPVTITLREGEPSNLQPVRLITTTGNGGAYSWIPDGALEPGDDYALSIEQDGYSDYTLMFGIKAAAGAMTTTSEPTSTSPTSTSPPKAAAAVTTGKALPSSTALGVPMPTPTSSFDSTLGDDAHLSTTDKIAIGVGVPLGLILLSTFGYWRLAKVFAHKQLHAGANLPLYKHGNASTLSTPAAGAGGTSRPASLWGAQSARFSSVSPEPGRSGMGNEDLELLVQNSAPAGSGHGRAESGASVGGLLAVPAVGKSGLRQQWNPV
ncbi:hypothetical protein EJ06DRAFT_523132 [Trichodelitschia bisporula]|uniref:Yeast cell wall synthesis Kre9/Knh1-like N-terminal domain-containing protein n=1 Tax=Trichodelitschia bisporula TaxID=703511 RepID=A0A6G1HR09_9PEZI|nr:hypothetical protein EJ06DRAFT_523132 [Trichodelitschia bisporula]